MSSGRNTTSLRIILASPDTSIMASFLSLSAVSFLGILSHRYYFIHGEHHSASPRIVQVYIAALMILYLTYRSLGTRENHSPVVATTRVTATYLVSLFSSIAVYRLFFHKTKRIPGPTLAKITKLYHVFNAIDTKQYLWLDGLKKKYGDFVRTGERSRKET